MYLMTYTDRGIGPILHIPAYENNMPPKPFGYSAGPAKLCEHFCCSWHTCFELMYFQRVCCPSPRGKYLIAKYRERYIEIYMVVWKQLNGLRHWMMRDASRKTEF